MSVQKFVTVAWLTIVRPSDPLAAGHLNNSPVEITLRLTAAAQPELYIRGQQPHEARKGPKVEAKAGFVGKVRLALCPPAR